MRKVLLPKAFWLSCGSSYKDDFLKQYSQYESQREIFLRAPSSATEVGIISLRELIDFVAHVADCFPDATTSFSQELVELLTLHHATLEPELREKIVGSLVLLRRKDVIDSSTLLHALFPVLFATPSKSLRALLFKKILSDLRNSNAKTTNHRLNRTIQSVLYNLVITDRSSPNALWAVKLTRELWKRQIWTEAKAVDLMKEACLADNEKVVVGAVRFFLGGDQEREDLEDESSDEEAVDIGRLKHQIGINKKTRKKSKAVENAVAQVKRKERKKKQPHPLNFSAFHLLHDPQGFAEALFAKFLQGNKSRLKLEQKLLVLQLVTRLVGLHKLTILSLYSYFIKHLTPRQASVTSFLASLAQATHSQVPPDALEPLVQKIANEFVSEASASEVASAGLNAIREICARQPLAINDTLLQDLIMYRKSKDKGVMMAARGLLGLYRDARPELLKKRDRGKEAALGLRSGQRKELRFGEERPGEIEGLELLEKWKKQQEAAKKAERELQDGDQDQGSEGADDPSAASITDESDEDGWEVDEDESDDSGSWKNVSSDGELEIENSDTDQPPKKRTKNMDDSAEHDENKENAAAELEKELSSLATSKILTPADLAKLRELRLEASLNKALPAAQRRRLAPSSALQERHTDDPFTAAEVEGLGALSKRATKADKVAMAKEGKTERAEHKSTQARRQEKKQAEGKSSTNKEKARKKNFMMTLGKAKGKQKRSLVEKGRVLKAHVERERKGGRRGNKSK